MREQSLVVALKEKIVPAAEGSLSTELETCGVRTISFTKIMQPLPGWFELQRRHPGHALCGAVHAAAHNLALSAAQRQRHSGACTPQVKHLAHSGQLHASSKISARDACGPVTPGQSLMPAVRTERPITNACLSPSLVDALRVHMPASPNAPANHGPHFTQSTLFLTQDSSLLTLHK